MTQLPFNINYYRIIVFEVNSCIANKIIVLKAALTTCRNVVNSDSIVNDIRLHSLVFRKDEQPTCSNMSASEKNARQN